MIVVFLLLVIIFCAVIACYVWYRLHTSLSFHVSGLQDNPEKYGLPFEKVSFVSLDGIKLSGWFIPAAKAKATVILVHGRKDKNGGKALMLSHATYLYRNGYNTFLFDMRGVGESEGNKITLGVKEWKDVVAAYNFVKAIPANKSKRVGLFGVSMGAATCIIAAGKEKIADFVIASVPYASFASVLAYQVKQEHVFPQFLFRWFVWLAALIELTPQYISFNPIKFVRSIKVPTFLMSAIKDTEVNPKDAWILFEAAPKPKEYWEAHAQHDIYKDLPQEFEKRILEFLDRYVVQ